LKKKIILKTNQFLLISFLKKQKKNIYFFKINKRNFLNLATFGFYVFIF
jgi:hypothetical protein